MNTLKVINIKFPRVYIKLLKSVFYKNK